VITWTQAAPSGQPPQNITPPVISGTPKAGDRLTCSQGTWTNSPTSYHYLWSREGTPLVGATSTTYVVQMLDEGTTLTCTVTASNAFGSASATSAGIKVPVPFVPRCPAASGSVSGDRIGAVTLGMTRAQARRAYTHSSDRGTRYKDFFCLTPIGVRVGYASPKLVRTLPQRSRARITGRVVWISTANPFYAIDGVRPGATLAAAGRRLRLGKVIPVGFNDWYLGPAGAITAVLKVRHGVVEEIGIGTRSLTRGRRAQVAFMTSFG
jgi:hypothetical protein